MKTVSANEMIAINRELGLMLRKIHEVRTSIASLQSYGMIDIPTASIDHLTRASALLRKAKNDLASDIKDQIKSE